MAEPAITVRAGIVKDFGKGDTRVRALHGIDIDVIPGELTYLVGESGSGKTTLISIIAGILYPTEGTVACSGPRFTSSARTRWSSSGSPISASSSSSIT
jgi:putative ABC transport system ATP-binding protein